MSETTQATAAPQYADTKRTRTSRASRSIEASELDTRLIGMVAALAVIWVGFHILSDGKFITSRNLWNLSVQSTSIAIMATGMVLIIVTRNIDLSVGALLGFLGYTMALVQTDGRISVFGLNITFDSLADTWYTWLVALAVGLLLGAVVGGLQGYIVAYVGVPAFIVTLGGFLAWRGTDLPHRWQAGPDTRPARRHVPLPRRRPRTTRSVRAGAGSSSCWHAPASWPASSWRVSAAAVTILPSARWPWTSASPSSAAAS